MAALIKRGKLLNTGGYRGLEAAVGKSLPFTKFLGHWQVSGEELRAAGATPIMKEYAFLQREIEFAWHP